jgi:thioredoxin reductase
VNALALGPEQDQQLSGFEAGAAEPVRVGLDAVVVAPRMEARGDLLVPLGLKPAEVRFGEYSIGTQIEADATGATAVPGVWVAGNLASLQAQVIMAAAGGLAAGAAINLDLVLEEARAG